MRVKLSYKYGSSPDFFYESTVRDEINPIQDVTSGPQQFEFIPSEGSTVTVEVPNDLQPDYQYFEPVLHNKVYYLLTNSDSPIRQDVIDFGTEITMTVSGDVYTGSFVFTNPDSFKNLFLIVDGTNTIENSDSLTFPVLEDEIKVIDYTSSGRAGVFSLDYAVLNDNAQIFLEHNGNIVAQTDLLSASDTGTIEFVKTSSNIEEIRILIKQTLNDNEVDLVCNGVSLKDFYISLVDGDLSNVCGQIADQRRYHNGSGTLPVAGDTIYVDILGTTLYNGNNYLHVINPTIMVVPSASSVYVGVDLEGRVLREGSCVCSEVAVPVITQGDIFVNQNEYFRVLIEASNNPFEWAIDTTCNKYSLSGGGRGTVYNYTDCDSVSQSVTVGIEGTQEICALALPTVVSGDGVPTLIGKCTDGLLPEGINFEGGLLSGLSTVAGETTIDLIASNCFGDSASTPINIKVIPVLKMKPLAINFKEFQKTGPDACTVPSANYELLYFNGSGDLPLKNDTLFVDSYGFNIFVGGDFWYQLNNSTYSIQVDSSGVVINTHIC